MKLMQEDKIKALPTSSEGHQTIASVTLSEPRLPMIERRLQQLLSVVQIESGGTPVTPTGFRLRDPAQWTSRAAPVFSDLWHISTACNMRCPFCYEEGDPPEGSVINEPAGMVSLQEIETRLKHRDRRTGRGLFQPLTYINEIFCNPQAMDIIERLRAEAPDEVFTFVTNGTYLTEDAVRRLSKLKPLYFNYSVNSLDPFIRERVLRDRAPATAIRAIELLRDYQIPYMGSLVCWPTIPWEDIENTVRQLDAAGCAMVRFSLSAYSKHLKVRRFDRRAFWQKGVEVARKLAAELDMPVKIEPYHFGDPTNEANLVGALVGSPAWRAGLRPGDRIVAANGKPVASANHALTAISQAAREGSALALELVTTEGRERHLRLEEDPAQDTFPYSELSGLPGFQYGLLLVENLQFSHLRAVADEIRRHKAQRVLLLSSELMKPIVQRMIAMTKPFGAAQVHVEVPPNRFFGGTVVLGDLLVVDDYVAFINDFVAANGPVDLAVLPSSPFSRSGWMRDLAGRPASDIERLTGIPVSIIDCRPLNG